MSEQIQPSQELTYEQEIAIWKAIFCILTPYGLAVLQPSWYSVMPDVTPRINTDNILIQVFINAIIVFGPDVAKWISSFLKSFFSQQ